MRVLALGLLALASCLDFGLGQGNDAGSTTTPPPPAGDASVDAGPVGTGCGTDPETGANLCLGISTCPGLALDPDAFPSCGFRVTGGATIDLECVCGSSICPIGVATSCVQAQSLLTNQTAATVCTQVSEGRCAEGAPVTPPPNGCDHTCSSMCGGDPNCIQGCGC